jgi:hypothetical protein
MAVRRPRRRVIAALTFALCATALPAGIAAAQPYCDPGWQYDHITRTGAQMHSLIPTLSYRNETSRPQSFSETQYIEGTVGFSAEGKVDGGVSLIVYSVHAELGLTVHASITAGGSITGHMTVSPHKTGHLAFGVWRVTTTGHNYYWRSNCTKGTDNGYVTTHTPWHIGYRAWETSA